MCSLVFIRSPPWAVLKQWRAVHVQHCNKSMPRFSQLFPQKYCQDICNASCYLLSPVTAAFPASYWSPFKREHFGCWGVCIISVCTCVWVSVLESAWQFKWSSKQECLSVGSYFFTQNTFMITVSCFGTASLKKKWQLSKVFFPSWRVIDWHTLWKNINHINL